MSLVLRSAVDPSRESPGSRSTIMVFLYKGTVSSTALLYQLYRQSTRAENLLWRSIPHLLKNQQLLLDYSDYSDLAPLSHRNFFSCLSFLVLSAKSMQYIWYTFSGTFVPIVQLSVAGHSEYHIFYWLYWYRNRSLEFSGEVYEIGNGRTFVVLQNVKILFFVHLR